MPIARAVFRLIASVSRVGLEMADQQFLRLSEGGQHTPQSGGSSLQYQFHRISTPRFLPQTGKYELQATSAICIFRQSRDCSRPSVDRRRQCSSIPTACVASFVCVFVAIAWQPGPSRVVKLGQLLLQFISLSQVRGRFGGRKFRPRRYE